MTEGAYGGARRETRHYNLASYPARKRRRVPGSRAGEFFVLRARHQAKANGKRLGDEQDVGEPPNAALLRFHVFACQRRGGSGLVPTRAAD